jgi:hypothetical protein
MSEQTGGELRLTFDELRAVMVALELARLHGVIPMRRRAAARRVEDMAAYALTARTRAVSGGRDG